MAESVVIGGFEIRTADFAAYADARLPQAELSWGPPEWLTTPGLAIDINDGGLLDWYVHQISPAEILRETVDLRARQRWNRKRRRR